MKEVTHHNPDWNKDFLVDTQKKSHDTARKDIGAKQTQIKAGGSPWVDECIKFCQGLRKLAIECHLKSTSHHRIAGVFGITGFTFEDGSFVGMKRAVIEAGLLTEDQANFK